VEPRPAEVVSQTSFEPVDLSELLVSEACEMALDHLCAVEALDRFVASPEFGKLPAASVIPQAPPSDREPGQPNRQALIDRLWRLTGEFLPTEVNQLAQHHGLASLWRLREAMSTAVPGRNRGNGCESG